MYTNSLFENLNKVLLSLVLLMVYIAQNEGQFYIQMIIILELIYILKESEKLVSKNKPNESKKLRTNIWEKIKMFVLNAMKNITVRNF